MRNLFTTWTARGTALLCLLFLLTGLSSASVLQTYTGRAAWETDTTGRVDIDFESIGLPHGTGTWWASYNTGAGLTIGSVNFQGQLESGWNLWAINPPDGDSQDFGSNTLLRGAEYRPSNGPSRLLVNLPAGVTSFGVDLASVSPEAASFRVYLDSVDVGITITTLARPNRQFFGVRTDTAITQVAIELNSGTATVTQGLFDNVSYGAAATGGGGGTGGGGETPEVTTMVYVGAGAVLMFGAKRRRRRGALFGAV